MNPTKPVPPSTIFADHMARLRALGGPPATSFTDVLIRLVPSRLPNLHIARQVSRGALAPLLGTTIYDAGSVAVSLSAPGMAVEATLLGASVRAATALHASLTGRAAMLAEEEPVRVSDIAEAEGPERNNLHAIQMQERADALRRLASAHDRPPSPDDLEWVARVLLAWAEDEPHPRDLGCDPSGWCSNYTNRLSRVDEVARMARDAAKHWRLGTPGVDADDAPAVAWAVLRALALMIQADDHEFRALTSMFPNA